MISSLVIRVLTATLSVGLISCGSLPTNNFDRRNPETQLVDEAIELRVLNRLITSTNNKGRVSAVSYGRRVLLLGEVPTAEDKVVADRVAASVDNVQRVISELRVMPNATLGQRSEDALINTRIQTALIGTNDLASSAFKVTTNQSMVYLMGVVSQREADRAVAIARTTPGVKQVINMLDLISEATLDKVASVALSASSAKSNLPVCPDGAITRWNNCLGTETGIDGEWYVGEFRDDKRTGHGIKTFADGRPSQEGIFENDKFVRAQRVPDHIAGRTYPTAPAVAQVTLPAARGPSASYGARVAAQIRPNVILARTISGNPRAEVEVRADADGKILSRSLVNSSGNVTWDQVVLTAIDRTGTIPRDTDGRVPQLFIIGLRPNNAKPDSVNNIHDQDHISGKGSFESPAVAIAPRQDEPLRPTLALSLSTTQPNADGVLTINITTNSDIASLRVNGDEVGGRADGRYSVNRFAQIGNNNFDVIATDRFGNTQRKTISVSRQAADNTVRFASLNPIAVRARPATNAVAIIIGIQDYSRVPDAEFANNDARIFYDYAIRGLGVRPENIKLLLDQKADQVEILSAFKNWLPLKTRKGQTDVYVFYSGHGLPSDDGSNLYMLPHGVDRQFLNETAIKQSVLIDSLQAVSPRSVTMFMDACYSGQTRTGETLLVSARPIAIQSKASSFPANFDVISASAPDQLASSSPDLKHGVFSYFLMKGMEGEADENKDGNITMTEMLSYLKENVGKKAMSLNRTQQPQLSGDGARVLVGR